MTIHASKGQQADFVIVLGLQDGEDAFPAPARESIMEQALLPQPEDFPDAEERRLCTWRSPALVTGYGCYLTRRNLRRLSDPAGAGCARGGSRNRGSIISGARQDGVDNPGSEYLRLTEVRRLDNKVSGGDVSGDRNVPDGGGRSNALTSGSWGTAFSGSQKKISTSILPSEMRAPTCWSPPIGPLSMALTSGR